MKTVRLIFGIVLVVRLGLLAGGFYSVQHTRQFLRTAVEAPGVVTENLRQESSSSDRSGLSWSYYPRIRFRTSDGQEIVFISSTGTNPPAYRVNEPVTVLYDPRQPRHAFIKSFAQVWMLSIILFGVGALLSSVGIGAVVWKGVGNRKNAWLQQNGRRIQAEITRVALDTSLEVAGKHPYRIVCQWLDPARNEVHLFHSANIWFDPTSYIPGKTIEVLVDPDNPRRYAVETAFLPKVV
jgi:hypothetical protein